MTNLSIGHSFRFFFHTCSSQDQGVSKKRRDWNWLWRTVPFWGFQLFFVEKGSILLDLPWVPKRRFKQLLIHKRMINNDPLGFIEGMQDFSISTSYSVWYTILQLKTKNHMIISRCGKGSDKIQVPLMIKTLQKVSTDGPYLNIVKTVYVKHTANIILNREKPKSFPLTPWIRQECSLLPPLLNIFLEVLATTIRKEKEIKGT